MPKSIIPWGKYLVVTPLKEKAGELIIPEANEMPSVGTVVAIGKDAAIGADLKLGSVVAFRKYGGSEIELDGTKYIILKDEDVFGTLKD